VSYGGGVGTRRGGFVVAAAVMLAAALSASAEVGLAGGERGPAAAAPACPAFLVLGSRGSGEPLDRYLGFSQPGVAFLSELQKALGRSDVGYWANPYTARGVSGGWRELLNALGAGSKLSGAGLGAYHDSVADGKRLLAEKLRNTFAACGTRTRFVFVGYSQGAQVAADVFQNRNADVRLSSAELEQVLGVVLFGDPYFNGGSRAARGKGFSDGRHGALGRRAEFAARALSPSLKVLSYCHGHDPICQGPFIKVGGKNVLDPKVFGASGPRLLNHENYVEFGEPRAAAREMARLAGRGAPETAVDQWELVVDRDGSRFRAGPWRAERFSRSAPPTPATLVKAFGRPSTCDEKPWLYVWESIGVRVTFEALGLPAGGAIPVCSGGTWPWVSNMFFSDRRWHTERDLRVGDTLRRLRALYPHARFVYGSWQLEGRFNPCCNSTSSAMFAEVRRDRVARLGFDVQGQGE
jgi:hypothetical protein